jgi:hypothetical protein
VDLHPWERQPYDTDESWPVFQAYRDQRAPRRGLLVFSRGRAVDPVKVAGWSRTHFWMQRAAEFDRHLDGIAVAEREAIIRQTSGEVTAEHRGILADLREVAMREANKLLAAVKDSAMEVVKPRELTKLVEQVIRLERLTLGETTSNVGVEGLDFSHLGDGELDSMLARMKGSDDEPESPDASLPASH